MLPFLPYSYLVAKPSFTTSLIMVSVPNSRKIMMISAPNKGHVVDQDTQIAASGNNVYVTWWTNKTGTLRPVFRASNDNGDTFAKAITLNSTG